MNRRNPDHVHILVVDDEKDIRDILQRTIIAAGYDCSIAENVEDALKVLEEKNVDVAITDIVMPGLDGIELTGIVKKKYDADVIVMTGFVEDYKYEEIVDKGASDLIQKPINNKEVLVRLKRVVKERAVLAERDQAEEELRKSYKKLRNVLEKTVGALTSALEKRDPYTAGHQQRVSKLACAIAKKMSLSDERIEGIRIAGLLHDIGKISVPTDVLNKPGKLSKHEFGLIKDHSEVGYDIMKDIEFSQPIAQIILQHHERMNGSGYPQGISGKNIILEARVLAVADIVESMVSHRPYRPALGIDMAFENISQNSGALYDSEVVDMCMKLFNENKFTFD